MPYKTPRTSNVVALLSDAKRRARVLFMSDGVICEAEHTVLESMSDALYEAEAADHARIEAIYALNFGLEEPPTFTHARRRRELQQARALENTPA